MTVRVRTTAAFKAPDVPVIVTVELPGLALAPTESVKVLLLVVLAGLNDAVTPLGKPDAVKLTLPAKPFCGTTAIKLVPLLP